MIISESQAKLLATHMHYGLVVTRSVVIMKVVDALGHLPIRVGPLSVLSSPKVLQPKATL